jgi:nucleoside-diphosphate-sugar epimerase
MGSENLPLHNNGIFHSLPTFDPALQDLTAVITGANGISGFHMLRALLEEPRRWAKVFALSRRPPPAQMMRLLTEDQRKRFQHIVVDFLQSPESIAQILRSAGVVADYVFFYSYAQPSPPEGQKAWSNADELIQVNGSLLDNLLNALPLAGITPRRFLLQTGGKNYGAHIGRFRTPAFESDPQPEHLQPNFYYVQERLLFEYCRVHNVEWNVIRPGWIIGAVNNAAMNALYPFAVFAAVQAHKGEPLPFPSDWEVWKFEPKHSTAMLIAYLSEWVVLEDKCKNEAFNSVDGGSLNWDRFFEELARWYGVEKGIVPPDDDTTNYTTTVGAGGKDTPMG